VAAALLAAAVVVMLVAHGGGAPNGMPASLFFDDAQGKTLRYKALWPGSKCLFDYFII
jgi:hypothetical protein